MVICVLFLALLNKEEGIAKDLVKRTGASAEMLREELRKAVEAMPGMRGGGRFDNYMQAWYNDIIDIRPDTNHGNGLKRL